MLGSMPERRHIAVEPASRPAMHEVMVAAVEAAGGTVVPIDQASGLIFADPAAASVYPDLIAAGPHVEWVQLPYAGIEPFAHHLDHDHVWTCGKGVYAPPVAEWIMTALLTAFRDIPRYVRSTSWPRQDGRNLLGAKLTILGGGGITESFMDLIEPWGCEVTVVRRSPDPFPRAVRTVTTEHLHEAIADADAVIIMDGDLQHPPRYIPELLAQWQAGFEVVSTRRVKIDEQPFARRAGSQLFYLLLNSISEFKMEPGTTDFRLLDRVAIEALQQFTERNRLFRGLIDWMGFKRTTIDFDAPARHAGTAHYSYRRLIRLALNSFMAFSLLPLKLAGYAGLFVIVVFGGLLGFMLVDKFSGSNSFGFSNIAFVIVTNVIMNGIVLSCIGLVALYIGHIHTEVIGRPLYIIRKRVGLPKGNGKSG